MADYYIGLMSGTSMDGIDAVLVNFYDSKINVHTSLSFPYPNKLKRLLFEEIEKDFDIELDALGNLDVWVGECFRDATIALIEKSSINSHEISAVGSHGQTLRHLPNIKKPFSQQIGNVKIISEGTGLITVNNFRKSDIAAGGQGAPLVPAFHHWLFNKKNKNRVIVNIGGISNITVLTKDKNKTIGFDTGPGNVLMDAWTRLNLKQDFDDSGKWSKKGKVIPKLINDFLDDPYFKLEPPKSTGFEYFNLSWLKKFKPEKYDAADIQSSLCELTVVSIIYAIKKYAPDTGEIYVCGGGVHNCELMRRLKNESFTTASTQSIGLDPDWVEASAFAWLAMRAIEGEFGNLPSVTGASKYVVLGDIYIP